MELSWWQLALIIALVVIATLLVASWLVVRYFVCLEMGGPPSPLMNKAINIPLAVWGSSRGLSGTTKEELSANPGGISRSRASRMTRDAPSPGYVKYDYN